MDDFKWIIFIHDLSILRRKLSNVIFSFISY